MIKHSLYILLLFAIACKPSGKSTPSFDNLIKKAEYSVVMFIAPDCPMCMSLSEPYNQLQEKYPTVQFLAVHSGKNYEAMELNMFATETHFKPLIFRDYDYAVAHKLNAIITPEFVLIDSNANILYQGLMDDRILELGSYKQQWKEYYLDDALSAVVNKRKIALPKTEPVGCVLEY